VGSRKSPYTCCMRNNVKMEEEYRGEAKKNEKEANKTKWEIKKRNKMMMKNSSNDHNKKK
jgi:hypothetical protein